MVSTKTTPLNYETHKCLKTAQTILYKQYDIEITIPDMIAILIKDSDQVVKIILENHKTRHS